MRFASERKVYRIGEAADEGVAEGVEGGRERCLAGLREGEHSGRPSRLDEKKLEAINRVLRGKPSDAGMQVNLWDGKTLSAWIEKEYGIQLVVRQCQRLFRHLDFRLRKPRPVLAKANPAWQKRHKKNSENL